MVCQPWKGPGMLDIGNEPRNVDKVDIAGAVLLPSNAESITEGVSGLWHLKRRRCPAQPGGSHQVIERTARVIARGVDKVDRDVAVGDHTLARHQQDQMLAVLERPIPLVLDIARLDRVGAQQPDYGSARASPLSISSGQ